jgi:hypothetical protein
VHRILVSKAGYSLKSAILNDTPLQVSGDEVSLVVKPRLTQRLQLMLEKN